MRLLCGGRKIRLARSTSTVPSTLIWPSFGLSSPEITLTSEDTFHGFRIAAAKINQVIPARGRGSVKVMFDAKEKGTYAFECSRPCGAGHTMMRGVIVVE